MEGFGFIIFTIISVAIILIVMLILLKRMIPEKAMKCSWIILVGLSFISISFFIVSLFIGGWTGMAYGLLSIFVLLGTVLAGFIYLMITLFVKYKS